MARRSPFQLTVQTPRLAARKDGAAFYIVPPILVAAVFAFCAFVPRGLPTVATTSTSKPAAVAASTKPGRLPAKAAKSTSKPTTKPVSSPAVATVAPKDVNDGLPEFAIPAGQENLLEGVESVAVSAQKDDMLAVNAVDGSCENDRHVAVGTPDARGEAWWQAKAPEGAVWVGDRVVIYGGGSASPAGKMLGGFRVDITLEDGKMMSRDFCKQGFALEGYESWNLDSERRVKALRVTALQSGLPVVLREVQLLGAATGDDDGFEDEEEVDLHEE